MLDFKITENDIIGIFDSGVGGLSVLKEILKLGLKNKIIYFGDTARVPYGVRSSEQITEYARQDVRFLLSKGVTKIIIACGTVSSVSIDTLKEEFPVQIIGVIDSASKKAVKMTKCGKIALIGTPATISRNRYKSEIQKLNDKIEMISVACPLFVSLVEYGFSNDETGVTESACRFYLEDIKRSGADVLILGCTHYPLLANAISSYLGNVELINTGEAVAEFLAEGIEVSSAKAVPEVEYYVSDDVSNFNNTAGLFLGNSEIVSAKKVDITIF